VHVLGNRDNRKKYIILNEKDNVATSLLDIEAGESVCIKSSEGDLNIQIVDCIPYGHKFSIKEIEVYSPVIKYGQVIGVATGDIAVGEHVHIHNVVSSRGRGDLRGDVEYEL
jgi:altronate dehydratase small subunit